MPAEEVKSLAELFDMNFLLSQIDFKEKTFLLTLVLTVWMVVHFNLLCIWEYRTRVFSKLFGSPYIACYCTSVPQIISSNLKNYYFVECLKAQSQLNTPYDNLLEIIGMGLLGIGGILVVTSFLRLGWTGTWHGDHFGILLSEKVTAFPFNVLEHPMYVGAKLNFLGYTLMYRSVVGMVITVFVAIVYAFTEAAEGSFTNMIYSEKDKKSGGQSKAQHKKRK